MCDVCVCVCVPTQDSQNPHLMNGGVRSEEMVDGGGRGYPQGGGMEDGRQAYPHHISEPPVGRQYTPRQGSYQGHLHQQQYQDYPGGHHPQHDYPDDMHVGPQITADIDR